MSKPEVTKQYVQGIKTKTMNVPTTRPKVKARTATWHEVSEWQRDNTYILSRYPPENAGYQEILTGLTFLHNETCNVYTHLNGALLLPLIATAFIRAFSEPQYLNVSGTDYVMFGIFFGCAEFCLVCSAAYHLLGAHSHGVEQFWHRMDLLGIIIVIVGTFIPGIYYTFAYKHWAIIMVSGSAAATLICIPKFRTLRWRTVRIGTYVALGASSFIPLLHGVQLYGHEYMLQNAGMNWYFLELVLYGGGLSLYGSQTPERFTPGRFDIWGASHQIFHVAILCAMYVHAIALMQAFTTYHAFDLCKIQATYLAG